MIIEYIETVSINKWEEIVRNSENGYFFHSPFWAKILEKTYGLHNATRLYKIEGNEVLIPMMKIKNILGIYDSMPIGYGGIFPVSNISSENIQKLLKNIIGKRELFLTMSLPPFYSISLPEDSTIRKLNSEWNYTHVLSLEKGFDYIWEKKFKKNTRTVIRKAERSGIEILDGNSIENFRECYKLYSESSKRWGYKQPQYPLKLYENMYKFGFPHTRLRLAVKDNCLIAGWGDCSFGTNVSAKISTYKSGYEKYSPIDLLIKDSIEKACSDGYKYYDFGASGNLEGVRKFKESFGAERVNIEKYRIMSPIGNFADILLRKYRRSNIVNKAITHIQRYI